MCISARMLKSTAGSMTKSVTNLLNLSLHIPAYLKSGNPPLWFLSQNLPLLHPQAYLFALICVHLTILHYSFERHDVEQGVLHVQLQFSATKSGQTTADEGLTTGETGCMY